MTNDQIMRTAYLRLRAIAQIPQFYSWVGALLSIVLVILLEFFLNFQVFTIVTSVCLFLGLALAIRAGGLWTSISITAIWGLYGIYEVAEFLQLPSIHHNKILHVDVTGSLLLMAAVLLGWHRDKDKQLTQLSASEEKFRQLTETIREVFWITTADENELLYVSPACEQIWGRHCESLYVAPYSFLNDVHPEDRQQVMAILERDPGRKTEIEYRILRPDGSICWIFDRSFPVYDRTGKVYRRAGVSQDITERKHLEITLRQNEEHLRQVLQHLPAMLDAFDADGNIIVWNQECEEVTGYRADEIIGNPRAMELLYPDAAYRQQMMDEWAARGNNFRHWEWDLTSKDGTIKTIAWFNLAERFPVPGWVAWGIGVDMTERQRAETLLREAKATLELRVAERTAELTAANTQLQIELAERQRVEQALRESEERFRLIVQRVKDYGIFMLDPKGYIVSWNEGAEQIKGYAAEDIIGQHFSRFYRLEECQQGKPQQNLQMATAMGTFEDIGLRVRQDGSLFWADVIITALRDEAGNLRGFSKVTRDITQQREVEQMKNEFISIVSHELRTPLTSIRAAIRLLEAGTLTNEPETAQRMLQIAMLDTERLVRLVNDILDLERLDSAKVSLNLQWCAVDTLVMQSVAAIQAIADQAGITLSVAAVPMPIRVDGDRIVQVLTNLLSNAIKFSPSGSTISLTVTPSPPPLLPLSPSPIALLFTITDEGRGIPSDKLEIIFQRFHQVDASDSRQKGGTGLGLAICRSIVQQHGGHIWAESILGEGSRFHFTLPCPPLQ
jgi:PAS domain S-box-containing protein